MKSVIEKAIICGFPISTYDLHLNYELITQNVREEIGQWIVTLNLEMIYRANIDKAYLHLLHKADLFVADGVPLIWASNVKKGTKKISGRSNGTDLVKKLLTSNSDHNFRIAVIGGKNPASAVKKYNPGLLKEAYFYDGQVDVDDETFIHTLIGHFNEHKTNIVFLNLGVPKQDKLAQKIRNRINSITIIGVGGSFDLLSGRKVRAPKWMQRNGMEWFYRLLKEPVRLSRRYLLHYPRAVYCLMKDVI